jgi:4,5-dihydroxyphthalate decarboxylase
VRSLAYDVAELATVTLALARDFGKGVIGLPIVLSGGFHHASLLCLEESPVRTVSALRGKKIAVRAYAQTTGVWVRGWMQHQYGVPASEVTWVTSEGSHVAEYVDPTNVIRSDKKLLAMLADGEVDAFVGAAPADGPKLRTYLPDARAAAEAWFTQTRVTPVNHVLSMKEEILEASPWLGGELAKVFAEARPAGSALSWDEDSIRASVDLLAQYSAEQGVTSHPLGFDDLFA